MINRIKKLVAQAVATGCYVGYIPIAPGTWGSMCALFWWWAIGVFAPHTYLLVFTILLCVGWWATRVVISGSSVRDPSYIVIDEWLGMGVALYGTGLSIGMLLLSFILFRVLDIFKWFGVKRCESLPGAWGVLCDDLLAGFYVFIIRLTLACFL